MFSHLLNSLLLVLASSLAAGASPLFIDGHRCGDLAFADGAWQISACSSIQAHPFTPPPFATPTRAPVPTATPTSGCQGARCVATCPAGTQPFDQVLSGFPGRLSEVVGVGQQKTFCLIIEKPTRWVRVDASFRADQCASFSLTIRDTETLSGSTIHGNELSVYGTAIGSDLIQPGAYLVDVVGLKTTTCVLGLSRFLIFWAQAPSR